MGEKTCTFFQKESPQNIPFDGFPKHTVTLLDLGNLDSLVPSTTRYLDSWLPFGGMQSWRQFLDVSHILLGNRSDCFTFLIFEFSFRLQNDLALASKGLFISRMLYHFCCLSSRNYGTNDAKLFILLLFSVQVLNVFISAWVH